MIVHGYAKTYYYDSEGTLKVQVRIPSIHGAYRQKDYKGKAIRNYVPDDKLPFYESVVLPRNPSDGDVVTLVSTSDGDGSDFVVIGLTGGKYNDGVKAVSATK